ncbi:MAG TPA: YpdA family putative bacillithiol disulfide reductase [Flavobacteriaceae bacterium]|nr:YpdA family putative bacillithiol disulfide reductase [Flavobacteriaceae bacterium]
MNHTTIIIGAGPIGIATALACKNAGIDYVVLEKGCLVNSIYNYPLDMTFFSTSERLEIEDIPFITTKPKPQRKEALEYYRRVATSNELNIKVYEEVLEVVENGEVFDIRTSKQNYQASNVVLATGFYDIPNRLGVPGDNLPKVHPYYREAHPYSLQKVVVVGASNSSVDAALEIWRKGGEVTMVIRGKEIGERVKYWVRPDIINRIEEGSIKAYFESDIQEITENSVQIKTPKGIKKLENDYVLSLIGYVPNFKFLASLGVTFSTDGNKYPEYNPETMESNVSGLYLAGVVCGGLATHEWFIENSRIHAKLIANHISEKQGS